MPSNFYVHDRSSCLRINYIAVGLRSVHLHSKRTQNVKPQKRAPNLQQFVNTSSSKWQRSSCSERYAGCFDLLKNQMGRFNDLKVGAELVNDIHQRKEELCFSVTRPTSGFSSQPPQGQWHQQPWIPHLHAKATFSSVTKVFLQELQSTSRG